MRKSGLTALLWLVTIVATVLLSGAIARAMVSHSHAYVDPATHLDLRPLLAMPIPVANKIDDGWALLVVAWVTVAIVAWCGQQLAKSLAARDVTWLLVSVIVAGAALVSYPVLFSADTYAYIVYGRLYGLHHINPYFLPLPLKTTIDPIISQCLTIYGNPPPGDNYGPLWTLIAGMVSRILDHKSLLDQVIVQRALALAFACVGIIGLHRMVSRMKVSALPVARYAFHPLLLFEASVGGHNDTMMIAAGIWAFALAEEFPLLAGLLVGCAIAIKYVAIIALPFLVVRIAGNKGWPSALASFVAASLLLVLTMWPFWIGSASVLSLLWQSNVASMSPTWLVTIVVGLATHAHGGSFDPAQYNRPVQIVLLAVFVVLYFRALIAYARTGSSANLWFAMIALLWLTPMLNPWYVLWLLPAVACDTAVAPFAFCFGLVAFARYAGEVPIYPPILVLILITLVIFAGPLLFVFLRGNNRTVQPGFT